MDDARLRILHLDAGLTLRGGQWQALRLLEGLRAAGHTVTLLCPAQSALFAEARARGFEIDSLGWSTVRSHSKKTDLVHAHDARAHSLAAAFSRRSFVVARRVAFPVGRSAVSRWKYARAAHYLAVSGYVARLLEAGGVRPDRITLVPDGVPLFAPASAGEAVVAPALQDPRKGTDLAEAAARLLGIPLRLATRFPEDLAGAGVFLYLTRSEGLGSAILLAMSAGVPVLASDVGGVPEIVRDRRTGLLTPNDPPAVAERLRALLADADLRASLAREARLMVEREFTDAQMIERTLHVYRKVLA